MGEPSGGDGEAVTVIDSAGAEIVISEAPQWPAEGGWSVSAEPLLRIGKVDSPDPALLFSRIEDVFRLSDGRIVVLESEAQELRYFDADGRFLEIAGRRGEGPGEFTDAAQAMRWAGDTVIVEDIPRVEHVFFGSDGEFVRQETLDRDGYAELGPFLECPRLMLPDRSRLHCVQEAGQPPPWTGSREPGMYRHILRYVRLPWGSQSLDTLGRYGSLEQWGMEHEGSILHVVHPFYSTSWVAASEGPVRIAIALNPVYSIEVWTPEGELERIIRRSPGRRAPTSSEIERAAEELVFFGVGDNPTRRARRDIPVPDSLPAIGGLLYSTRGELLVRRHLGWAEDRSEYDVFDPHGRWLGTIHFPDGLLIHEVGDNYILGVRRDELNVPYVEMYGLERPG